MYIFAYGTFTDTLVMANIVERVDVSKLPKKVSQPYLLTSNFNFNLHEARIVNRVLQQIKQHQYVKLGAQIDFENNVVMRFRPKDLTASNDLKSVKAALSSIRKKEITFKNSEEYDGEIVQTTTITGFISEAKYDDNNSFVDIKLNSDWYNILVNLTKGYTPFLANVSFSVSNVHHFIIYQYICHWYKKGEFEGTTLNEAQIRKNFKIDKYDDLRKIVSKVLEPCKKELDSKADKSFNYTLNRIVPGAIRGKGAKIVDISFKFYETEKESIITGYNPKRAAKKISELRRIHGLTLKDEAVLGALAKKYDLSYLSTVEYEHRESLLKANYFMKTFHNLLKKRKN